MLVVAVALRMNEEDGQVVILRDFKGMTVCEGELKSRDWFWCKKRGLRGRQPCVPLAFFFFFKCLLEE